MQNLTDVAYEVYLTRTGYRGFLNTFNREQLVALWGACQSDLSLAFDDEVYDALNIGYNHFK